MGNNVQYLLDKLTKPEIKPDGTIFQPNAWMLKAAEVIKKTSEMGNNDVQGRMVAQIEAADNLAECERLRELMKPVDISEYQEAMNRDRD